MWNQEKKTSVSQKKKKKKTSKETYIQWAVINTTEVIKVTV